MSEVRENKVKRRLVLTAGATSANETLMFCLAEPGEAFLIPTPYYPGYVRTQVFRYTLSVSSYLTRFYYFHSHRLKKRVK